MLFPTIVIDNFFDDTDSIIKYSNTLDYKAPEDGSYPGTRSPNLDKTFFQFSTKKMMAALYPMNYRFMTWAGSQFFQKINGQDYPYEGWVHQDFTTEITAIVYLSKENNCGTAINTPLSHDREIIYVDEKHEQFKEVYNKKGEDKDQKKYLDKNNSRFKKTINVDSVFNRLILFDSSNYHSVINFGKTERLTLITFIGEIRSEQAIKYPLSEMRRS